MEKLYRNPPFRVEATFGTGSVTIFLEKSIKVLNPLNVVLSKWGGEGLKMECHSMLLLSSVYKHFYI